MKQCGFCNGAGVSWYPIADGVQAACRVCHGTKLVLGVEYTTDSIFASDADALVCPVNTVGVMGAGLAKAFDQRYPGAALTYYLCCETNRLEIGAVLVAHDPKLASGRVIVFFPTKQDWRKPSRPEYIEAGLRSFANAVGEGKCLVRSVSFPQLGCGRGGLDWERHVKPLMEQYLAPLPIRVLIHQVIRNQRPNHQARSMKSQARYPIAKTS